mmetsp:Transcript_20561/g.36973  ORF Transcript_20561/g.36973 Transcript_20561/m.36973 type:complete len:189 (+) Transcript_20561:65-631(+)
MTSKSHAHRDCELGEFLGPQNRKVFEKDTFIVVLEDLEAPSSLMRRSLSEGALREDMLPEQEKMGSEKKHADQSSRGACSHRVLKLAEKEGMDVAIVQKLEDLGLLDKIPQHEDGCFSSVGSLEHATGDCKPCIFWFRGQCRKKLNCMHCHFAHPGQKKKQYKPNKRARQLIRQQKEARLQREEGPTI